MIKILNTLLAIIAIIFTIPILLIACTKTKTTPNKTNNEAVKTEEKENEDTSQWENQAKEIISKAITTIKNKKITNPQAWIPISFWIGSNKEKVTKERKEFLNNTYYTVNQEIIFWHYNEKQYDIQEINAVNLDNFKKYPTKEEVLKILKTKTQNLAINKPYYINFVFVDATVPIEKLKQQARNLLYYESETIELK